MGLTQVEHTAVGLGADPGPYRDRDLDVVVIGAGQAGLSAAYHLRRDGLSFVVLDADPAPGGAWSHRWPSLLMESVHGVHDLPGMAFPEPDPSRPAREAVPEYFAAYERTMELPVIRPVRVTAVRSRADGRLEVSTDSGTWTSRALINASGTWRRPFRPYYPGAGDFRGRQLHTADYRSADEFRGQHVVVVGGGTSAIHFLAEIAAAGGTTTWVTRRPPQFTDEPFTPELGRQVVARVADRVRLGLPPESVVSVTGLPPTPAVRAAQARGVLHRLPMFDRITPDGVAWDAPDGPRHIRADAILWATGFRAALDHLAPLALREPGGGIRMDGTHAAKDPRIHLIGYGPSASTVGANRAGRTAADAITRLLAERDAGGRAA
ncbi:FAD-dependent oxidoreductase [Yinghuangia soli]|uniref:NAD(P)/FAD-dependent oxidoreductase n=1 Tax=Yinghuangia soli TaxID=2908204 RepID=A0AA41Q009_9ACTN|nr:FAD-dependent oxidoreductase [Yinghuangia soli]MCF2528806.1 NAD(P)/FAD-dependent oxidoreductase [Yinghuangia soli]